MIRTSIACLLAAAGLAAAESVVLTIDPGQSGINVDATLDTPVGADNDTAASSISGTIEIELDDYGVPTSITLHDFIVLVDNNMQLNFDYGFAGEAHVTLVDTMAMYAFPGTPVGPVALAGTGFDFGDVPADLAGPYNYDYSFFLVGSGNGSGDLSEFGVSNSPFAGDVTSDGETVTLTAVLEVNANEPVLDGLATMILLGDATIVATGDAPAPAGCNPADIAEPFGVLDLADIGAFVSAFLAEDPAADIAPPAGVFDLADLQAFITSFTAGCP